MENAGLSSCLRVSVAQQNFRERKGGKLPFRFPIESPKGHMSKVPMPPPLRGSAWQTRTSWSPSAVSFTCEGTP